MNKPATICLLVSIIGSAVLMVFAQPSYCVVGASSYNDCLNQCADAVHDLQLTVEQSALVMQQMSEQCGSAFPSPPTCDTFNEYDQFCWMDSNNRCVCVK